MNMQAGRKNERAKGLHSFDVASVRRDFPILNESIHGKPLVYLDNAATAQKPLAVIDSVNHYYRHDNANIHRGVHLLSERATDAYENTRAKVRDFLNASDAREIVFVRGTTEAINLVAHSYGGSKVMAGDEVVISTMEHHSNIVPWQLLCEAKGASLRVVPITDQGEILLSEYTRALGNRTKLVALAHVSNALGTVNPIRQMIAEAHARGIPVLVDGAQAVPHIPVDVQDLDCDFYAFSGHKLYGPTGVGVLYGKSELLDEMPPYQGGGDMILSVTFEKTEYNQLPHKFEAGTPNMAGVIGFGAAIDYIRGLGLDIVAEYEDRLLDYAVTRLRSIPGVRLIGNPENRVSLVSFVLDGIHAHDVGTILDQEGVAVRTGHHCAMPVMDRFGVPATVRASFACYNTKGEVDALVNSIEKVREVFGGV
jgi:cysteine desulfurase/selenocysteine lyase